MMFLATVLMLHTVNSVFVQHHIIRKPDFAALLEMVTDVQNVQMIPWLIGAMCCLSDASANQCQNVSKLGKGLHCDNNGNLIGIDLSHLNLTGNIHLESLPQSVRSLDLSFNDLDHLNLDGLRGKSLERLNVEHNKRCHINTECLCNYRHSNTTEESGHNSNHLAIRDLQLSSNQIFPWILDSAVKLDRIRSGLCRHQNLVVIVDGLLVSSFHIKMRRVLEGVTNKEIIPLYDEFTSYPVSPHSWKSSRIEYTNVHRGHRPRYRFDLSGLGLIGEIRLKYLPRSVSKLDLSNNNLSKISFNGNSEGQDFLEELNLRNNDNLRINLLDIAQSSLFRYFCRLSISSNQLHIQGIVDWNGKIEYVRDWSRLSRMTRVVVDGIKVKKISTLSASDLPPFLLND